MSYRDLPSVDSLMQSRDAENLTASFGRSLTLQAIRERLEAARDLIRQGGRAPGTDSLFDQVRATLESWLAPSLRPVINATGVIVHTNLGRAPLSLEARQATEAVAAGYSTLEYDLQRGARGDREKHAESLLCQLTGAEAALTVNNNAAAVLLALTALGSGKEVLISRSQLIEIGGGFRLPDVMRQSGAVLVEVGTTNRTHLWDYEAAVGENTGLILRAHRSNFKLVGFTTEPTIEALVELGRLHGIPVFDDLGSGALLDSALYGLGHEPMVQESIQAGVALAAFSGDKLLGGPQAGLLVGQEAVVEPLRRHPLARAVRPDKLCLAALTATLTHYLKGEAVERIPVWRMIAAPEEILKARATAWRDRLGKGEVVPGRSTVGGGSLPEETLPTWLLAFSVAKPNASAAALRHENPPVIARVEDDQLIFDPRTVMEEEEERLLVGLERALLR